MSVENMSIVDCLERHAQTKPEKTAFIFVDALMERRVLTRRQVWDYSRKFAAKLRTLGVKKGEVVCNTLPNSPQRIITDFGAVTAGCIAMNGQICMADGQDFIHSLNKAKATAIILDPYQKNGAFSVLKSKLDPNCNLETGEIKCQDVPSLKFIITPEENGADIFENLDVQSDMLHEKISHLDVCHYMCTSGSTSFFKVVAFNSRSILEFGRNFGKCVNAKECDILMINRPLGWLGGYPAIHLATGVTRVLFNDIKGRPDNYAKCRWDMAYGENCDICFTATTSIIELNEARLECEDEKARNYRFRSVMTGGGPVTVSQMNAALGKICDHVAIFYASTEGGTMSCLSVTSMDQFEQFNAGSPIGEAKVVGEDGMEVACGEQGAIMAKTSQSALYYVDEPEKTLQTFRPDGWVALGDIGRMNSDGQLYVIGRDKFAIMRGPIIHYPFPVESFLLECPYIKDVCVVGVPDERAYEEICAFVIAQEQTGSIAEMESDIRSFLESRVANQQVMSPVPKYFLFVEAFPLTLSGKVDRVMLKKIARDTYQSNVTN